MNPISNRNVTFKGNMESFITKMTKADALGPIIALEGAVVAGRTLQAYKRGKGDEARERFLEEITGSIVWLWGVKVLNEVGDKILGKVLKNAGTEFDVGTDKVLRTPFENFMKKVAPKGFSATQVAMLKGAKVLSSILLANLFIGFVVPKINHTLTNVIRHNKRVKEEQENKQQSITNSQDKLELSSTENKENTSNPSFKGALSALNSFTNAIENTNTGKLLSTDFGIAGGRMYNARSNEERREIAIRDLGSIYFYMWAQGHVRNILNYIESGHASRLNPETAKTLNEQLIKFVEEKGGSISIEEFKTGVLGKADSEIKLPENINFESAKMSAFDKFFKKEPLQVIKVSELEKVINDEQLLSRIREMSKLQPNRLSEAIITKQQLIDSINKAEINDPKMLNTVFSDFTDNVSTKEFKYVSNSKLYNLKNEMREYVEDICKSNKNGKITKELLEKAKKKNLIYNGVNFAAGFVVAAAFLSTFIPKIQYYVTRKTTGVDAFPGTYDYEHHHEIEA